MSNKDRKTHAENLKGENLKGENLKGENLKGENLRSTWTKEQVDLLKKLVLEKKTYAEIYSKFPRVSNSAVRSKISKLRNSDSSLPLPDIRRKVWTAEDDKLLKKLYEEQRSLDVIKSYFPDRTKKSIKVRLTEPRLEKRKKLIANLPWSIIEKKGFAEIKPDQWPIQTSTSNKSIFIMVNKSIINGKNNMKKIMRDLLEKAENENKSRISFLYCENKQDLVEKLNNYKQLKERRKSSKFLRNLVLSSLLADGGLIKPKPNFPNIFFQFTQAANILTKNGESHLEYALWFLGKIESYLLTPVPFYLEKGIPKQKTKECNLKNTWKARVWLWNFDFFEEAYVDNYRGFKENRSKTDAYILATSKGSLLKELEEVLPQSEINSIDSLPEDSIQSSFIDEDVETSYNESKDALDNYSDNLLEDLIEPTEKPEKQKESFSSNNKNLPPLDKLEKIYLSDPGFAIAHMHMQDGDLFKISNNLSIPRLFIQTVDPIQTLFLSKAIYETTGLKYLPVTYKKETKIKPIATVLYLCPGSINLFVKLTSNHILPCMDYKQPKSINGNNSINDSIINKFDVRFEKILSQFF
jgi:hypothetical protein